MLPLGLRKPPTGIEPPDGYLCLKQENGSVLSGSPMRCSKQLVKSHRQVQFEAREGGNDGAWPVGPLKDFDKSTPEWLQQGTQINFPEEISSPGWRKGNNAESLAAGLLIPATVVEARCKRRQLPNWSFSRSPSAPAYCRPCAF